MQPTKPTQIDMFNSELAQKRAEHRRAIHDYIQLRSDCEVALQHVEQLAEEIEALRSSPREEIEL